MRRTAEPERQQGLCARLASIPGGHAAQMLT
jgi:hypothetical protein